VLERAPRVDEAAASRRSGWLMSRLAFLMEFLAEDLRLSRSEWIAMRSAIDARLRREADDADASAPRRTLLLRGEPLGALRDDAEPAAPLEGDRRIAG
jgi:hypothetical protein